MLSEELLNFLDQVRLLDKFEVQVLKFSGLENAVELFESLIEDNHCFFSVIISYFGSEVRSRLVGFLLRLFFLDFPLFNFILLNLGLCCFVATLHY
jgi:hypothetical protein